MIKYIGKNVDVIGHAKYLSVHREDMTSEEFDELLSSILEDAIIDGFYMGVDDESNEEAIEIAESRPADSMELIENLVSTDEYDIYNL